MKPKNLKQIIRRSQQFNPAVWNEMEIQDHPYIYSVAFKLGSRTTAASLWRKKAYNSLLRCQMPSYTRHLTPVVLLARFYVEPNDQVKVTAAQLRSEVVPALGSFEVVDYLLSLMEMLKGTLFHTYRQIVKVDAEKFYSHNPRTTFKFMSWENYVKMLKADDTNKAKAKEVGKPRNEGTVLQPQQDWDGILKKKSFRDPATKFRTFKGALADDSTVPDPSVLSVQRPSKTRTARIPSPHKKT